MKYNFMYIILLVSTEIVLCLGISTGSNANTERTGFQASSRSSPVKRSPAFKRLPGWSVYYGKRAGEIQTDKDSFTNENSERIITDISNEIISDSSERHDNDGKQYLSLEQWLHDNTNDFSDSESNGLGLKQSDFKRLQAWVSRYGKSYNPYEYTKGGEIIGEKGNAFDDEFSDEYSDREENNESEDDEKRSGWQAMYGKRSPAWFSGYGKRLAWNVGYGKRSPAWTAGYGKRSPAWFTGYGKRSPAWFTGYGKRSPAWFTGYGKRSPAWFTGYGRRAAWLAGYGKRSPAWTAGYGKRSPAWFTGYGKRSPAWFTGYGKRSPAWFTGYGKRVPSLTGFRRRSPAWFSGYGKRSPAWTAGYGKREEKLDNAYDNELEALQASDTDHVIKDIQDIDSSDKESSGWSSSNQKLNTQWSPEYKR